MMNKIFLTTSVSFFIWGIVGVSLGVILPDVSRDFNLSLSSAGTLFVVWSVGFSLGSVCAARMLRTFVPLSILALLSLLTSSAAFYQSLADSYFSFAAASLVMGMFGGCIFTSSHTLIGTTFPDKKSLALSMLDICFSAGNILAPLGFQVWDSWGGWRCLDLILGIAFLFCSILFVAVGRADGSNERAATPRRPFGINPVSLPRVIVLCLAFGSFGLGATEWTQNVWFVTYAIDQGIQAPQARTSMAVFTGGMMLSRILLIVVGSKVDHSLIATLLFAFALLGSVLLNSSVVHTSIPANLLTGLGIGALLPIVLGAVMDLDVRRSATYSMIVIVSLTLGGQVASGLIGVTADRFGMASAYRFIIASVMLMVIGFGGLFIDRIGRHDHFAGTAFDGTVDLEIALAQKLRRRAIMLGRRRLEGRRRAGAIEEPCRRCAERLGEILYRIHAWAVRVATFGRAKDVAHDIVAAPGRLARRKRGHSEFAQSLPDAPGERFRVDRLLCHRGNVTANHKPTISGKFFVDFCG